MANRPEWDKSDARNKLYGRKWREARAIFLRSNPHCKMCAGEGKVGRATVVDHIVPHKGDYVRFWTQANWQPLCEHHHNADKAIQEAKGYSDRVGKDGWPVDPLHPAISGVNAASKSDISHNGGASNHQKLRGRTPLGKNKKDLVLPPNKNTNFIF